MAADNGTGATIAFGTTTTYTPLVRSIDFDGIERVAIRTSSLGTTTAHTYIPGDLYDGGEVTLEVLHDESEAHLVPILGAAENITITFPGGDTYAFSGFVTRYNVHIGLEEEMTAGLVLKVAGAITGLQPDV